MKDNKEHNEDKNKEETITIPRPTSWEIAALEMVSEDYWDNKVLACESWVEARDEIAIDGLLGSLVRKLENTALPDEGPYGEWPLGDEERIRQEWLDSGGKP